MDLYYAAAESNLKELSAINVSNLLITMAHGSKKIPLVKDYFEGHKLIIDSGAFTYFKKGGMKVEDWIQKADALRHHGTEIISLDVIGNAEESYTNYLEVIKHFNAMPTFHVGSDIKYLKKYLETTDRIAIGGMVGFKSEIGTLRKHLNEIFSLFSPNDLPKFHAFGYFSQQILQSYPFFSADASTWQNYSRFGEFHKFEDFEYKRIKSLKVDKVKLRSLSIEDATILKHDEPLIKLQAIKNALDEYEHFLTSLWTKRKITWK